MGSRKRSIRIDDDNSSASSSSSSSSKRSKSSQKSDSDIISVLPEWESCRFVKGKGFMKLNIERPALAQFSVLGRVDHNWLENSQYDTRTLVVSGVHISKFHAHLLSADSYYKVPDFEDVLYLKCKTSYRLPILDENKCSMEASNISDGDRVMCTFTVSHWLLKSKEEGFKMNLLAIRHLPCEDGDEDNFNPEIYTGPDF